MSSFTTYFKDALIEELRERNSIEFRTEEIEYSGGEYKIRFDGYGETKAGLVILEIELRREDPINNLVKTLYWLSRKIRQKKTIMFQIYDKTHYEKPKNRYKKDFTLFLAKRCHFLHKNLNDFFYVPLDVEINHLWFRRNDKVAAHETARTVAEGLTRRIKYFLAN